MQINSASLLAAQQARAQAAAPRAPATPSEDPFEPLFVKAEPKPSAPTTASAQANPATLLARPGSQIDIRV